MGRLIAGMLLAASMGVGAAGGWSPPQPVSHSTLPSGLQYNFGWAVAVDGAGVVHATWLEFASARQDGQATGRVMYSRSPDDGRSWAPPFALTPAPQPATGHPRVAASGPYVYVTWHGLHDGSGVHKILLLRSADHGTTWDGPHVISDNAGAAWPATWPSVNACGSAVHVVWTDARSGVPEIRLRSSHDGGTQWTAVTQVSEADGRSSWTPTVACRGAEVHVAWSDDRHNVDAAGQPYDCGLAGESMRCREEEYYRRSRDFGVTWDPEVRLTHDAQGPRPSWAPSIAVEGDFVHVVFFDSRTDRFQVYYTRSARGGEAGTWEPERLLSHDDGASLHARPVVAARGADVHVVWYGITPSVGANVFYAGSVNHGTGFARPRKLTAHPIGFEPHPSVAASSRGSVHVIWYEPGFAGIEQIVHRARRARPGRIEGGAPEWD